MTNTGGCVDPQPPITGPSPVLAGFTLSVPLVDKVGVGGHNMVSGQLYRLILGPHFNGNASLLLGLIHN